MALYEIYYAGLSMILRAIARYLSNFGKALYNIFIMQHMDGLMLKLQGQQWIEWKNEEVINRTNRVM